MVAPGDIDRSTGRANVTTSRRQRRPELQRDPVVRPPRSRWLFAGHARALLARVLHGSRGHPRDARARRRRRPGRRRIARGGPRPSLGCCLPDRGRWIARRPLHRAMARLSRAAEHEPRRQRRGGDESRRFHSKTALHPMCREGSSRPPASTRLASVSGFGPHEAPRQRRLRSAYWEPAWGPPLE
jgi:hypothetical protein